MIYLLIFYDISIAFLIFKLLGVLVLFISFEQLRSTAENFSCHLIPDRIELKKGKL